MVLKILMTQETNELKNIIDFGHTQIFDGVTTYCAISVFERGSDSDKIGYYNEIFKKATSLLNDSGELYYSCVNKKETKEQLIDALKDTGCIISNYHRLEKYGLILIVPRITKKGL